MGAEDRDLISINYVKEAIVRSRRKGQLKSKNNHKTDCWRTHLANGGQPS